jgi:hypothetical protein
MLQQSGLQTCLVAAALLAAATVCMDGSVLPVHLQGVTHHL